MRQLVSSFLLQRWADGQLTGQLTAATLLIDISGFTAVTETLMTHGKVGAETLADVMQTTFTPLIDAVTEQGGFVAGFAGDALTAVFPGRGRRAAARAVSAAVTMQRVLTQNAARHTPFGTFHFAGRVGVAQGYLSWTIFDDPTGRTAAFRGPAIRHCAAAEQYAPTGQVVITRAVAAKLQDFVNLTAITESDRFFLLESVRQPLPVGRPHPPAPPDRAAALAFHPPLLLDSQVGGEFRQVVSLFVGVKGNPRRDRLATFMSRCHELVARFGAYLCRLDFGDKGCHLLLFWGAPSSRENDLERALNFVLELRHLGGLPLRAGLTERVVFAGFAGSPIRQEYTCYGIGVNQAARQMAAAGWGEIWVDETTAARAPSRFIFNSAGPRLFKGLSTPQLMMRLVERRRSADPFFTGRLIGRSGEIAQLNTALDLLRDGRFGGVWVVSGEAGVGKSRLVHELIHSKSAASFQRALLQTDEIVRQPLNPFRYWLRRFFRQEVDLSEKQNKARFDAVLHELGTAITDSDLNSELQRTRSFLGALVDLFWDGSLYATLSPALRQENTVTALKTLIKALSRQRPLIIQLEDVHWLDPATVSVLPQLVRQVAEYPFALIATSRDPAAAEEWPLPEPPTVIHLGPLAVADVQALAEQQLGEAIAPELAATLHERADGNPFFAEQLLLYLREEGALRPTAAGLTADIGGTVMPLGVQAVVVARLDRLTATVRDVVQTAAVLGREFEIRVLAHMLRHDHAIEERVQNATDAAIWMALNELRYLFKHALLRDAAYEMQLQTRLRGLHRLAAEGIEQVAAADLAPHFADLAYHWGRAGQEENERRFAILAGRQAADRYANEEGLAFFERAVELTPPDDINSRFELLQEQEKLLSALGHRTEQQSLHSQMRELLANLPHSPARQEKEAAVALLAARLADATAVYDEAIAQAQRAAQLAEEIDRPHPRTDALVSWAITLWHQGRYEDARPILMEAAALARRHGYTDLEADAYSTLGLVAIYQGQYEDAPAYLEQALAGHRQVGNRRGEALAINSFGVLAREIGDQPEMRRRFEASLAIFRDIGHRWGISGLLNNMGLIHYDLGEYELALGRFADALVHCREIDNRQMVAMGLSNVGMCTYYLGRFDEAERFFAEGLAVAEEINDPQVLALVLDNWATLDGEIGRYDDGVARAERAVEYSREMGKPDYEISTSGTHARLLTALGRFAAAETIFERALELCAELKIDYLDIEIKCSRVELWLATGRLERAVADAGQILDFLASDGAEALNDRLGAYGVALEALAAAGDPRLVNAAQTAHAILLQLAAKIEGADAQRRFMEGLSGHRRIQRHFAAGSD